MATRKQVAKGGARKVNAAAQGFVDSVARSVADKVKEDLPTREEFRELKKAVRELQRKLRSGSGSGTRKAGRPRSNRKCEVAGCNLSHVAQGFCSRHYQARRREEMAAAASKPARKKARKR
ncbi:MAG: hypothetical protein IFK94_01755 [Acidobacteria bacterium]|uniref:Vegetative protein n=1 Tax=Candidatus Polarisedimenticola svalbardensis TaxID=2886004 RepID=A0A8J7CK49_9BACT|nr:hypothetical protein [Candidatus Polarisedimenticola svalbardensis]